MLDEFRSLVDQSSSQIESIKGDGKSVCEFYGIDTTHGYGLSQATDEIYNRIRKTLETTSNADGIRKSEFYKLQQGLVYRKVLYDETFNPYNSVLCVIRDATGHSKSHFPRLEDEKNWLSAIGLALDFLVLRPGSWAPIDDIKKLRREYSRTTDVAESLKFLDENGCDIEINDGEATVLGGTETIISELDECIKSVGGLTLSNLLFQFVNDNGGYSSKLQRFMFGRRVSFVSFKQNRNLPYGYLLNKSIQYPYEFSGNPKELQPIIERIELLSKHLCCGMYDVQPYSVWENLMNTGETIIDFIRNIALYDSIYTIPQCRPDLAISINEHLFDEIDEHAFEQACGFRFREFLSVHAAILELAQEANGPIQIYLSTLTKNLKPMAKETIHKVLNSMAHQNTPNTGYQLPGDYPKIDFFLKPLIRIGETKYLLMDKSWSSPAFYEALATILRAAHSDFDSKVLGRAIEKAVYKALSDSHISFITGNYSHGPTEGESDAVIETEKAIILVEIKKKVLTRNAKSGDTNNLFIDLADSLMASQIQAGKAEIILRETGELELEGPDGNKRKIIHNDRYIERLTLTHLEYGGFQDRNTINQFLRSFFTHSYNTNSEDPWVKKKFKQLAEKQKVWNEQAERLREFNPEEFDHYPLFNSWFLSLPQFMHIIERATDNESFYEVFRGTKHVTSSSMDFYQEFLLTNVLKSAQ